MRFKNIKKIKKNKVFSDVYKKGKRIYLKNINIFFIKTARPDIFFGITTSRKFKTAVARNKARRRALHVLKHADFAEKTMFVVFLKETAVSVPHAELKEEILNGLLKTGIIKQE